MSVFTDTAFTASGSVARSRRRRLDGQAGRPRRGLAIALGILNPLAHGNVQKRVQVQFGFSTKSFERRQRNRRVVIKSTR
jgi:hypothetical protein